jgi:hypothetical protein
MGLLVVQSAMARPEIVAGQPTTGAWRPAESRLDGLVGRTFDVIVVSNQQARLEYEAMLTTGVPAITASTDSEHLDAGRRQLA